MEEPSGGEHTATARAHSNIALVKYWGKRDAVLNVPAVGSISITLDALVTDTTVTFHPGNAADELWLDGRRVDAHRAIRSAGSGPHARRHPGGRGRDLHE